MATTISARRIRAVLTQLKTIFIASIAFTSLKMIRGSNIVKEIATEIIGPTRINPLYFNAIDIPLLHTKIRVAIKFERNFCSIITKNG
jgi:hypothetical protein